MAIALSYPNGVGGYFLPLGDYYLPRRLLVEGEGGDSAPFSQTQGFCLGFAQGYNYFTLSRTEKNNPMSNPIIKPPPNMLDKTGVGNVLGGGKTFTSSLTLSHMASKVPFTIWQRGWRDTPKRTTLAQVKTILGAYWPPVMPWPAGE